MAVDASDPHATNTGKLPTRDKSSSSSDSLATGSTADLRAKLEGYRCPACDRAFYVQGNEEAYSCPTCGSKSIWQMVGPFTVASVRTSSHSSDKAALASQAGRTPHEEAGARRLLQRISQWDVMDSTADGPYWRGEIAACLAGGEAGRTPPPEQGVHHMKHGDGTVCGAAKERGNSYYEWAYVNCPVCLATRPAPPALPATGERTTE